MDDTTKYLIHADITAAGVVERSDVVGAIFGQTEGLLGEGLDIRDLQQSSKLGRIDVDVESENGQSFGQITIASSLDKVETAILAASLETITRVGPCRSRVEVAGIEDVRAAKRREVVERAKELLGSAFNEDVMSSQELLAEVRESVRVEDITTYEGLPAGPNVESSDAVIVVEGRADVLTLLRYGIKNAICVEGTDVPNAVAELSQERTVTAFLDGDRGGDLILRELGQVGDIDYVARAPSGRSVEDLSRHEVTRALRKKVPFEAASVEAPGDADEAAAVTDGSTRPAAEACRTPLPDSDDVSEEVADDAGGEMADDAGGEMADDAGGEMADDAGGEMADDGEATADTAAGATGESLADHVAAVIGEESETVRLLADGFGVLEEGDADEAFDLLVDAPTDPYAVVVDGTVTQRLLDVAAQRGVPHLVGRERGQFTKQPTSVRVRTAAELLGWVADPE